MKKVDIIGGGIAGLALAARLDPGAFEVTVYEQRPELPAVGTTLAMWGEAQRALSDLGILGAVRSRGSIITAGALRDPTGEALLAIEGEGVVGIARPELLKLLDSAVPASVERVYRRAEITPGNAWLTVGADGVNSIVRRNHWGRRRAARPPFPGCQGSCSQYARLRGRWRILGQGRDLWAGPGRRRNQLVRLISFRPWTGEGRRPGST
ncbi:FAD-dependent oxidoreductase [Paenarthrobacter nicotinovorans]|uniref:FAD-dependent oxidoreductase n=1 Tax=Paenarthrobacter nicotinovorans TaxID=29320 RepID=UPI003800E0E2